MHSIRETTRVGHDRKQKPYHYRHQRTGNAEVHSFHPNLIVTELNGSASEVSPKNTCVQCLARQISYMTKTIAVHKIRKIYGDPSILGVYHVCRNRTIVSVAEIEVQKTAVTTGYGAGYKVNSEIIVPWRTFKVTYQHYVGNNARDTNSELLNGRRFRSQAEAKMAVFEWIEGWYNPHRRHSSLGYRSPVNYERAHQRSIESAESFCRLRRQTALAMENT
jgi:transposase InsO family protein